MSTGPPAVAGPGIEPGSPAADQPSVGARASWVPAHLQDSSDEGESRTRMPQGHDILNVACLPIPPLRQGKQPVRESNPYHENEGLVS